MYTQSGQYQVSVSATDEDGTYTATGFAVTVNNVNNDAPVLAPITTQVVAEGSTLSFVVTATDPDGVSPDRLTNGTFSAGLTGWTLDAGILASVQNGELAHARNNAAFGSAMVRQTIATQAGQTYRVQADVSANTHAAVFLVNGVQAGLFSQAAGKASFTFTATGASTQLAIGGTNALVAAFRLDNVRVNLDGANAGDILTYSLVSGPAGASINPVTGQFTWAAADGPVAADVTVRVQDDGLPMLAHERTFSVAVANVAPALTVSGAAATFEDLPYVLTLSASADPGRTPATPGRSTGATAPWTPCPAMPPRPRTSMTSATPTPLASVPPMRTAPTTLPAARCWCASSTTTPRCWRRSPTRRLPKGRR